MKKIDKRHIKYYINHQILFSGTLSEIKDLLLYFELIQFEDYRKLAGLVNNIHQINALDKMAWGVYNLDYDLRHHKKAISFNYFRKTINFRNKVVLDYFLEQLNIEIDRKLKQLSTIFNSKLITERPQLLSSLLDQLQKAQDLNGSLLGEETVTQIITHYFKNKKEIVNPGLITELVNEFNRLNQVKFKQTFALDHSEKEIIKQRQFYILCTQSGHIQARILKAKESKYVAKGASHHMATGDYATIITGITSVLAGILASILLQVLSVILQWTSLLIPISTLMPFISPLGGVISIITLIVTIYLQNYLNHRRSRYETELKRDLIYGLARDVPEYAALLAKSGFDLRGLDNPRFFKGFDQDSRPSKAGVDVPPKLLDQLLSPQYRCSSYDSSST